jgi:cell wall-associated NlpC family hydrolase
MNVSRKIVATAAITGAVSLGLGITPASATTAATYQARALSVAKTKTGDPYQYGAAGPYRFDCSGLLYYSFRHVGHYFPRTAQGQYNYVGHEAWQYRKPGDLVAIGYSSRSITHVGIYVGYWSGKSWAINAPHTGTRVRVEPIANFLGGGRHAYYGRLR